MLCRLKGSFDTLAVTSALSPRQPVQTSHFSPCSVAVEPLFSHRGVTATSQMASRWLLCCPTNGPLHLVDVTFTYFYPPKNSLFLSLISMDPPWPLCHLPTLIIITFTSNKMQRISAYIQPTMHIMPILLGWIVVVLFRSADFHHFSHLLTMR